MGVAEGLTRSTMERYDPADAPIPGEWLVIDEGERLDLVERFHREARISPPNLLGHAAFHVAVENQLALPDQVLVRDTLQRLIFEGLSRHDALHAVASVLAVRVYELLQPGASATESEVEYHAKLRRLTAKGWRSGNAVG
jgi:hypothetical protein